MKICECGEQARVIDSRIMKDDNTLRRYRCVCGRRWRTLEVLVPDHRAGTHLNTTDLLRDRFAAECREKDAARIWAAVVDLLVAIGLEDAGEAGKRLSVEAGRRGEYAGS